MWNNLVLKILICVVCCMAEDGMKCLYGHSDKSSTSFKVVFETIETKGYCFLELVVDTVFMEFRRYIWSNSEYNFTKPFGVYFNDDSQAKVGKVMMQQMVCDSCNKTEIAKEVQEKFDKSHSIGEGHFWLFCNPRIRPCLTEEDYYTTNQRSGDDAWHTDEFNTLIKIFGKGRKRHPEKRCLLFKRTDGELVWPAYDPKSTYPATNDGICGVLMVIKYDVGCRTTTYQIGLDTVISRSLKINTTLAIFFYKHSVHLSYRLYLDRGFSRPELKNLYRPLYEKEQDTIEKHMGNDTVVGLFYCNALKTNCKNSINFIPDVIEGGNERLIKCAKQLLSGSKAADLFMATSFTVILALGIC